MDYGVLQRQAIAAAFHSVFPEASGDWPLVELPEGSGDRNVQMIQCGSDWRCAIPHAQAYAERRSSSFCGRKFHVDQWEENGWRVTKGVDPYLFILREGHMHRLYYAFYRVLVEIYRAIPLHASRGMNEEWKIWVEDGELLVHLWPLRDPLHPSVIPPLPTRPLVVVGTDAGLWLGRAWSRGTTHPHTVWDLLENALNTMMDYEMEQPPLPIVVPGLTIQGRQAVIL